MKRIKIILSTLLLLLMISGQAWSQSKSYAKLQYSVSWENYNRTWFKAEKKRLRAIASTLKSSTASEKKVFKRLAKLTKYREEIASISARKEGNDE